MENNRFNKIVSFYKRNRRMPSYAELMPLIGLKSKGAVQYAVQKLIQSGLIRKDKSGRLTPGRSFFAIPLLGTVVAGFPSPAEEELADVMSLDEYLIENKDATFMLKVSGDSMQDAGIMPGDIVLVERGREAKNNDIVIAEVDGEWTMKYFRKRGNQVSLVAANAKYKPIIPEEALNIAAVVRSVIRKY
jgi:SOS regulatory protein LexA